MDPQAKGKGQYSLADIAQGNQPSTGQFSVNDIIQAPVDQSQPAPEKPGFFSRTAESLGIPKSIGEAKAMLPDMEDLARGGGNPVGAVASKMVRSYGSNLKNQFQKGVAEAVESAQNVKEGGPKIPNIKKTLAAGTDFALRGVLPPVGGNVVANMGQDSFDQNYPAMGGDIVGAVTNALLAKGAAGPSAETSANRLAWATKGEQPHILNTLNDVKQSAQLRGKPINTVGDYLESIKSAKNDMNTQAGIAMQPIAGQKIIPVDIAMRIKSLIKPWMDRTPEGLAMKQKIMDAALPFESQEWTYRDLDSLRTDQINPALSSYYKKGPGMDRYTDLKGDPSVAIDQEIVHGIQDAVYPQMDAALGKPTGYIKAMKQRQSNLMQLESEVGDTLQKLSQKTAEIKGGPRFGTENASVYQSGFKEPGFSFHKVQNIIHKPNPLKSANTYVGKAFAGGSPTASAAVYSLPVRYLLTGNESPFGADNPATEAGNLNQAKQQANAIVGQ
jgi:hypothetical protein